MTRLALLLALLCPAAIAAQPPGDAAADPYAAGRAVIEDLQRIVTPNGVQESFVAELGGTRQAVSVRGADRDNPLLVFIHGGPGAVEMPIAWTFQRPWEDFFTVVHYDQRGAGKSHALNDPATIAPTLVLERYRDDAIELIEQLRTRYGKRRVVLLGHSWGSMVGLSVAKARPDLLHAYVGIGQALDFREGERIGIAWTRAQAQARGDADALRALDAIAPYPDTGPFTIDKADGWRAHGIRYGALAAYRGDAGFYLRAPRLSPEYTAEDLAAWGRGSAFSVTTLWPRLRDADLRGIDRLEVPVVLFNGRHDYTTPTPLAEAWLARLDAPSKVAVTFEHSAHLAMIEEPGRVFAALLEHVRPLADGDAEAPAR